MYPETVYLSADRGWTVLLQLPTKNPETDGNSLLSKQALFTAV